MYSVKSPQQSQVDATVYQDGCLVRLLYSLNPVPSFPVGGLLVPDLKAENPKFAEPVATLRHRFRTDVPITDGQVPKR